MKANAMQEQIDKFYKETGYQLEVKDGKPYCNRHLDLRYTEITELPDNLVVEGSLGLKGLNITKLPNNLVVGGALYLGNTKIKKLPDNLVVGGYLDLRGTEITELPDSLVVGDALNLEGTKIAKLPENLVVGGSLFLSNTPITKLPNNLIVGVYLDLYCTEVTELPDNLVVGECLFLEGQNIVGLPKNLAVGGNIYGRTDTPIGPTLTQEAKERLKKIKNFLQWNVGGKAYIKVDDIFSVVDSHKGNVWRTHRIGKDETLYVVTDGEGHYAHGKTLKEAKADLIYKINDRDTSAYNSLSLDDEVSFEEAIAMYRTITGACSAGTRDYVESRLPEPHKEKYTIREVIALTDGEYGSKKLKEFFKADKR